MLRCEGPYPVSLFCALDFAAGLERRSFAVETKLFPKPRALRVRALILNVLAPAAL